MGSTRFTQDNSNEYARWAHPNFCYDQYVALEAARYEAAAKVTAAALARTQEERSRTAAETKLIVDLYLDAFEASRPIRDAEAHQLAMTVWPGGSYYTNLIEPKKSTQRKEKVKRAKKARRGKTGTKSTPTEQQEQAGPILPMKERIYKAWENLKAKVDGSETEFYDADKGVGYKFVLRQVSKRLMDTPGECATDQHDVVNRILYEVSQNIDKVQDIYKVLCSAAKKQGSQAFLDNTADRKMHEGLMIEVLNEQGKSEMVDNPAIGGVVRTGMVVSLPTKIYRQSSGYLIGSQV